MITDKTITTKSHTTIKLGIDAHAKWYYVARQVDGATPQPVQKMDLDGLLHFVAKQQGLAQEFAFQVGRDRTAGGRLMDRAGGGSISWNDITVVELLGGTATVPVTLAPTDTQQYLRLRETGVPTSPSLLRFPELRVRR